jgi:hypothetical protein
LKGEIKMERDHPEVEQEFSADKLLIDRLRRLRPVPPLDLAAVEQERTRFLAQAAALPATGSLPAAVSPPLHFRLKEWMQELTKTWRGKERRKMLITFTTIMVILVSVFGSIATVSAAQGSLPGEVLYPVKTWSEDARLALASANEAQLDLNLAFSEERLEEIVALRAAGQAIPEGTAQRFEQHLEAALQNAAGLDDDHLPPALEQIRLQAEAQFQVIAQLAAVAGADQPILQRLQTRLQEQARLAGEGSGNPDGFRQQIRDRDRVNRPTTIPNQTQVTPNQGAASHTPMPTGTSLGPGPGSGEPEQTPAHTGPGGPGPNATPEPTGESYGPGPNGGEPSATPGGYEPGPQGGTPTGEPFQGGEPSHTPGAVGPGPGGSAPPTQAPGPGGRP